MPKKKIITECLTDATKLDLLKNIEAGIICFRMKSNALKKDLESGRTIKDMKIKINSIDNYIVHSESLKNKVSEISFCK